MGQPGSEAWLAGEVVAAGAGPPDAAGPGWAGWAAGGWAPAVPADGWCFAQRWLRGAQVVEGASVNALAGALVDAFLAGLGGRRVEGRWPLEVRALGPEPGLGRRAAAVEEAFRAALARRMGRVARLAAGPEETPGSQVGWQVELTDFGRAWAAAEVVRGGQRRMADDPAAPSRSYLKVEEAFVLLGAEPGPGETVVDLGAAPGGWSYAAARRGAEVWAVDHGPLKAGAAAEPRIRHCREDAFGFRPPGVAVADWLLCDMVEEPGRVAELLLGWVRRRACRRLVANFKLGRTDAVASVRRLREQFAPALTAFRLRQLHHDREEVTLVGSVGPG